MAPDTRGYLLLFSGLSVVGPLTRWRVFVTMPQGRREAGSTMPDFCDVALPVPLDNAFTYRIPEGMHPVVGGRVLVPFRQQRMSGAVSYTHLTLPTNREV